MSTAVISLMAWGWAKVSDLKTVAKYQEWEVAHPFFAMVSKVVDGDTFEIEDERRFRLLGIDTPDRGERNYDKAVVALKKLIEGKPIWLEYDRYQDDSYGRVLAWVWINCEGKPKFLPYDYMHLSYNESRVGLVVNPEGCKEGKLINEEMINKGLAKIETFKDRGELKYENRLRRS